MKRYKIGCYGGVLAVTILVVLLPFYGFGQAKKAGSQNSVPLDPALRTGKLANGFTYYIRHNEQPKNRVELYLVNKVGSVLEDDNQQGLAHFIEHMNFNGTKHYPKNELVDYLQKAGIRFGADLNAYTSFEETVYQLPMATNDPAMFGNGIQIMRDWAQDAMLDSVEIEKERGVILEEERLGKGAKDRMSHQSMPMLFNYSRYAQRLPIGKDAILTSFKPEIIRRFYHDWYRPDLQALIVVGDIDVNEAEKMIREKFDDLKNPLPEKPGTIYQIPLSGKQQYMEVTDKEQTNTVIDIMMKLPPGAIVTSERSYLERIKHSLLVQLLGARRFAQVSHENNPAFTSMGMSMQSLLGKLNILNFEVVPKNQKTEEGFEQAWRILNNIKRYGFTATELETAKKSKLASLEAAMKEMGKISSVAYVKEYQNLFLHMDGSPGMDWESNFIRNHINDISLSDINAELNSYLQAKDIDILVTGPDQDKHVLPDAATVHRWIAKVDQETVLPFKDEKTISALLVVKPKPGKVVETHQMAQLNITTLTLSNGVKVILKPTDFKNDQIIYSGYSPGGVSLYDHADFDIAGSAAGIISRFGLGNFNPVQLSALLNGKQATSATGIAPNYEVVNGSSSTADLETALQLTYLQFTHPRKDSLIFNKMMSSAKESISVKSGDPNKVFADTIGYVTGNYDHRFAPMTVERLNKITMDRAFDIYKDRFADASGFTFVFVGNFTVSGITPLLEQYLGALPSLQRGEHSRDLHLQMPEGHLNKKVFKGTEDKATVKIMLHGDYLYNPLNNLELQALGDILQVKILQHLREQESEVYSPSVQTSYHKSPHNRYMYTISFGCAPKNANHLIAMVEQEMASLRENGPQEDDIQKFKASYQKGLELALHDNGYWLKYLTSQCQEGEDLLQVLHANETLEKLNVPLLKNATNQYLTGENTMSFELLPEHFEP